MNILESITELLIRIAHIPEVTGILGGLAIPLFATLYRKHLEKTPSNGPKTITLTSVTGESIKIKLGNMTDEEEQQLLERLRKWKAQANGSTSTT